MKIRKEHLEAAVFLIVYLFALYVWTQPFHENQAPYGEFDAISHWELGDFIAQRDRTFVYLPPFLDFSYGGDNKFKPHTLWYPPPFHTNLAIISSFAGDRMVPIYFTNAVFATAILISVFFVVRNLFGFYPGILSMFLLIFSMRDIMPYLWGQWPERFAYAFIPLVLYTFYKYYTTWSKQESKPIYLYIMAFLLAVNMMIHPLVFFHSAAGLAVLGVMLAIKQKKIPLNFKHYGIAVLIFLLLFAVFPYQSGNVIKSFTRDTTEELGTGSLSRLLQWAPPAEDFAGSVPPTYFDYAFNHGAWTLPLLLLGILVLVVRRENRDIFLLAWLISLYLVLHRDVVGKANFLHRSLSATAHIFVPITVIGALSIPSILPILKKYKTYLKYAIGIVVVVLAIIYNYPAANNVLENAYNSPIIRINPAQVEVSEWLKGEIPETQNVSIIGPPQPIMQKVWWMASYSHRTSHFFEGFIRWEPNVTIQEKNVRSHLANDYIVFDYSDIGRLQDQSIAQNWLAFEQANMGNHSLVYNKNNIRVYKP